MIQPGHVAEAADLVRSRARGFRPAVGLILGSGLSAVADGVRETVDIPYADIPRFPAAGVAGHTGQLKLGRWAGVPVAVLQGRAHFYEGHDLDAATLPVRVLARLGATTLAVTNAAGSLRRARRPGSLMVIRDHLNLMGTSPLRGPLDPAFGPRFVDLTAAYDADLRKSLKAAARRLRLVLHEGVYAALPGPQYETPAEVRMLQRLGADAAGMSTVPEVIVARQAGLRCLGISCLTNLAAGLSKEDVNHADVLAVGKEIQARLRMLLETWLKTAFRPAG